MDAPALDALRGPLFAPVTADSASEQEVGSLGPNERLVSGAGDNVVTGNSGAPVVLETTGLTAVRDVGTIDKEVLTAGEGQIVTSVGNGSVDWPAVASTDSTVD